MNDTTLAQTYVKFDEQWYFVSTINRQSSARESDGMWYSETMVWTLSGNGVRDRLVFQDGDAKNSIVTHQEIVKRIYYGGFDTLEEEEE